MAENGPQINPANQGMLRQSFAVDDLTTDCNSRTNGTIGGVVWMMGTDLITVDEVSMFGVYLSYDVTDYEIDVIASYVIRLLGVDPIEIHGKSRLFDGLNDGLTWGDSDTDRVPWSKVIDPSGGFMVDGRITIEIHVTVEHVIESIPTTDGRVIDLDDVEFADMRVKVKGEDGEGIQCHKAVICRNSEAIHGAMTNASTMKAKSGVFEIGDPIATKEGVEQFVRLNYEEWKEETMDQHAIELFVLGELLLCPRVKMLARPAIKRLLAVDTFWSTLKAAVRIDDIHIVQLCVRFAGESLERQAMVIDHEDAKEIMANKDKEGVAAFLVLMKKIGEIN